MKTNYVKLITTCLQMLCCTSRWPFKIALNTFFPFDSYFLSFCATKQMQIRVTLEGLYMQCIQFHYRVSQISKLKSTCACNRSLKSWRTWQSHDFSKFNFASLYGSSIFQKVVHSYSITLLFLVKVFFQEIVYEPKLAATFCFPMFVRIITTDMLSHPAFVNKSQKMESFENISHSDKYHFSEKKNLS